MDKIYIILCSVVLILLGITIFSQREWMIKYLIEYNKTNYPSTYLILRILILVIAVGFLLGGIKIIMFDLKNSNNFITNNFGKRFSE